MQTRRILKQIAGYAAAAALFASVQCNPKPEPDTSEMNILVIVSSGLTVRAVGCYGNDIVKTPGLDRLAAGGIRFTRAYCQAPMRHPSRAVLGTGIRPEATRIFTNRDTMNHITPRYATGIASVLKKRGAVLINIGTLFGDDGKNIRYHDFDRLAFCGIPDGYQGVVIPENDIECTDQRLRIPGAGRPDSRKACLAARMLRELAGREEPFFMSVSFSGPGSELSLKDTYSGQYNPGDMILTEAQPANDRGIPEAAKRYGALTDVFRRESGRGVPETPEQARDAVAAYYDAVTMMDGHVEYILDILNDTGLAANTAVVFVADHGFHLGEHGLWGGCSQFDEAIRVPMIFRVPGLPGKGEMCDQIVELADVLPTLCDLWGIQKADYFEGSSFISLLRRPGKVWKQGAFSACSLREVAERNLTGYTIRTRRYRYTEWGVQGHFGRELYDFDKDPLEQHNEIKNPEYTALGRRLSDMLARGWKGMKPTT